jgi:hypothetical protein
MLFPRRHAQLVFSIMMSIYMVIIMTAIITWVNTGLVEGFLSRWWRSIYIAWPIAFLLIKIGAPRLQVVVTKLLK